MPPIKRFGSDHLARPRQIVITNDEILIREPKLNQILIFSLDGKFKMTLSRAGEGPGENKSLVIISVANQTIYCYDFMGRRIHLFSQKDKKFLRFIPFSNTVPRLPPHEMVFHPNGSIITLNMGYLKEHTLISVYNSEGVLQKRFMNAYPDYQNDAEFDNDITRNGFATKKSFKNNGSIAIVRDKLYFANIVDNQVLEMDINGIVLKKITIPLPSHKKIIREYNVSNKQDAIITDIENELTFEMKSNHETLYILCQDSGFSYVFRLVNGSFQEVCKMKEALTMFDIANNQLYALEEEPTDEDSGYEIFVYQMVQK